MEISDLQVKQIFIFSLEGVGRARHLIFQVEKKYPVYDVLFISFITLRLVT